MAIKVLHVFPPGFARRFGGQTFFWKYCFSCWKESGVQHFVLDDKKNRLVASKDAFSFEYPGVQKMTSRWERVFWIYSLFKNLLAQRKNYDILHMHVLWWGGLLVGLWSRYAGIPALYESVLLDADTPGGIVKQSLGRVKLQFLKLYKAVLTISSYLAEDYLRFGFSTQQVTTLINCVDLEVFSPVESVEEKIRLRKKSDIPEKATVLIFVGSLIERKGVDLLIQAFVAACSQCKDLHLLMVGPKNRNENPSLNEDLISDIYLKLSQKGLVGKVSFLGLIQERQRLAELYRSADAFVFPSRNEGLGNVVLEAMASGLPVIVSRLPVLEKVVLPGENGFVVPIDSVEHLSDAIATVVTKPELARKIGQNARRYVETHHSFSVWEDQLVNFYKSLVP